MEQRGLLNNREGFDIRPVKVSKLAPRFIYFLGPEGAGKTTMAGLLSHQIKVAWAKKVRIIEIRSSHLHVHYLKKLFMKLGRVEYYKYPLGTLIPRIDRLYLNRVIKLWLFMEFIAIIILVLIKVRMYLLLSYIVICTRYVIDTIVDLLAYTLAAPQGRSVLCRLISPLLLRLIPKCSLIIYLNADYDTLIKRYKKRGSYVEPPNWINFYKETSFKLLKTISHSYKITFIDTNFKSPSQVLKEILWSIYE